MSQLQKKIVAIIVAHPNDETLWVGGTILSHPTWDFFIVCLCGGSDKERAAKFYKTLKALHSNGILGDLDDGRSQKPLDEKEVEHYILDLLPPKHFDLIITHHSCIEYIRHIRHEEVSKAVIKLWQSVKISTNELWTFAYKDVDKEYDADPVGKVTINRELTKLIWLRKYIIITEIYGFAKNSWEVKEMPGSETFWQFTDPHEAIKWFLHLKVNPSITHFLSFSNLPIYTSSN